MDGIYENWARILLGAKPLRNGALAELELGWKHTGSERALVDIASRRCYLWQLPQRDLYRQAFERTHKVDQSWSHRSLQLLTSWDIMDYPCFMGGTASASEYKAYVKDHISVRVASKRQASLASHVSPCALPCKLNSAYKDALSRESNWHLMQTQRAFSQLRLGYFTLVHLGHKRSQARYQHCIFCNQRVLSGYYHTLCACG